MDTATRFPIPSDADASVSLGKVARRLQTRWWQPALAMLVGAGVLFAASYALTPTYLSKAVLAYENANTRGTSFGASGALGGLAALAGMSVGASSEKNGAVGTLKSRALIEELIEKESMLPELFSKRWDPVSRRWLGDPKRVPTLADGYRVASRVIRVDEDATTGLIEVKASWKNPTLAARWLTVFVQLGNRRLQQQAVADAQANVAYLQKRLTESDVVEMRQAISSLLGTEMRSLMLALGRQEYAFRTVDPPFVPDRPDSPNRLLLGLLGALLGLFATIVVALRAELKAGRRAD